MRHVTLDIHDVACPKHIRVGANFVLAPGYEELEERRKKQEQQAKERTDKKMKQEYIAQKWDKDRDQKYRQEVKELERGK